LQFGFGYFSIYLSSVLYILLVTQACSEVQEGQSRQSSVLIMMMSDELPSPAFVQARSLK